MTLNGYNAYAITSNQKVLLSRAQRSAHVTFTYIFVKYTVILKIIFESCVHEVGKVEINIVSCIHFRVPHVFRDTLSEFLKRRWFYIRYRAYNSQECQSGLHVRCVNACCFRLCILVFACYFVPFQLQFSLCSELQNVTFDHVVCLHPQLH